MREQESSASTRSRPKPHAGAGPRERPAAEIKRNRYGQHLVAAMRRIRKHLLQDLGLDPVTIVHTSHKELHYVNYTAYDYSTDDQHRAAYQ